MSGVTYTFSPNTKAKATEVNQNFTDCLTTKPTAWTTTVTDATTSSKSCFYTHGLGLIYYSIVIGYSGPGTAVVHKLSLPVAGIAATTQNEVGFAIFFDQSGGAVAYQRPYIDSSDVGNLRFVLANNSTNLQSSDIANLDAHYIFGFYRV
jgi:hypothetical protein